MHRSTQSVRAQGALASAVLEVLESRCLLSAFQGHVYAADGGAPLQDITVALLQSNVPNDGGENATQFVTATMTNADGYFYIEGISARNYRVVVGDQTAPVEYAGQDFQNLVVGSGTTTQDFQLDAASAIEGHVYSMDQVGVEGIQIQLFKSSDPSSAGEEAWEWVGQTTTDSNGRYVLQGLEARHYRVWVGDGAVSQDGTHYISANLYDVATVEGATTTGMDLHLREAGLLYGYVYNTANQPLANVQVVCEIGWTRNDDSNNWHTATTDATGKYTLYLPVTDQRLYPVKIADAPVAGTSRYYATQIAGDLYSATSAGTRGFDFHLSLGGVITGSVVTDQGQIVANVQVVEGATHITNGMFEDSTGWTDEDGYFEVHGVPADRDVYLRTDEWGWSDFSIGGEKFAVGSRLLGPFRVAAGGRLNIGQLVIPTAGTLRGVVTDTRGNPIVGANVMITGVDTFGGSVWLEDDESSVTDALGQYRATAVPPGRYTVVVSKAGWPQATSVEMVVESGGVTLYDVVLQDAASGFIVEGVVTNFDAAAPKNKQGQRLPFGITDNYEDYDLPGGIGVITVPQGRVWTVNELLQPDNLFTGQTLLDDGFADYFEPGAGQAGSYHLDLPAGAQSLMLFRNIATGLGTWQVILSDAVSVNGSGGETVTADLTAPLGTSVIKGRITLPSGYRIRETDGANSVMVWLKDTASTGSPLGRAGTSVAPDGQYALRGLPAGTYNITVAARGLQPFSSGTITVAAGQTITSDFTLTYGAKASGKVTSGQTPVANAVVRSQLTGFMAVTDENGDYTLTGLLGGSDTLLVQRVGYTDVEQSVLLVSGQTLTANFDVQGANATITGRVVATDLLSDGIDNNDNGQTDEAGEQYPGGIAVVAYNKDIAKSYVTYSNNDGIYDFVNLAPGSYRLVATGTGFESGMYPSAQSGDLLIAHEHTDLTGEGMQIALALARPQFTVTSSSDAIKLTITIHSDLPLQGSPLVSLVQGGGTLGSLVGIDSRTGLIEYTLDAQDTLVQIQVQEDPAHAVVAGQPSSRTFSFDVAAQLQQLNSTTFVNAQGATLNMMGSQDNATVYLPPFALTSDNSGMTQATTLTVSRYGDPGQSLDSTHTTIASSYDFVIGDDGAVEGVQLSHEATLTMSFKLPAGLTEAQFRQTLRVGFYNNAQTQWVWNDLVNSNPTSGISDIQINWLSSTLSFKAAHFTKFALSVVPVNVAPKGLSVSRMTALQKWPRGTVIGTLSASDSNIGDTFRFSLVSGTGSTHNSMFRVVGKELKTYGSLLYPKSYSIRLRVTDAGGLKYEKPVTIRVNGINAAPTKLSLSRLSVAETQPIGTVVGTFSAGDPNAGESFTYSLVSGTGSAGNANFTISGNQLKTQTIFNYEGTKSYSIRVRVADRGGLSLIKIFTIAVTNVNEAPQGVALSPATVLENQPMGSAVGMLAAQGDPDRGNTYTYTFTADSQANAYDNGAFAIVGNQLKTNAVFDYEGQSTYEVLVRATDQGGLFCDQLIAVSVGDVLETA